MNQETESVSFWKTHREGVLIYIGAILMALMEFCERHWSGGTGWLFVTLWTWLYYSERVLLLRMFRLAKDLLTELQANCDKKKRRKTKWTTRKAK